MQESSDRSSSDWEDVEYVEVANLEEFEYEEDIRELLEEKYSDYRERNENRLSAEITVAVPDILGTLRISDEGAEPGDIEAALEKRQHLV